MPNFYPKTTISTQINPYYSKDLNGFIDLRQEFADILYGTPNEPPKGQFLILRKMKRKEGVYLPTSEDDLVKVTDINPVFNESQRNLPSEISKGERFLFEDILIKGYRWQNFYNIIQKESFEKYLINTANKDMFFIEWVHNPCRWDKLIEPITDTATGKLVSPIAVWRKYNIQDAEPYKGDYGRVEFWRLTVTNETDMEKPNV